MKKKILHILNTGSYSGAENVAITIIKRTSSEFDSVYLSLEGSIRDVLDEQQIKFYPVPKVSVKYIKKAIKEIKPDVIHAHDFTAGVISAVAAGRIPIVNHLHNNTPWIKRVSARSLVYGLSCVRFKKILTVSPSVFDEYVFGSLFRGKMSVIGNPIDIEAIQNRQTDQSAPSADVIFLGRLTEAKNPLLFLDIIAELKKTAPKISAVMVGDGELRRQVEQRITELSLEDSVLLAGFQKNPYSYIRQSKVMCMPSRWEGFGLAAVECLALGKPVVAAPVGGLPTFIDDTCGKFAGNLAEFAAAVSRYLEDEAYYKKQSEGALARAVEIDNISEYIYQMELLYTQVG